MNTFDKDEKLNEAYETAKTELVLRVAEIRDLKRELERKESLLNSMQVMAKDAAVTMREIHASRHNSLYVATLTAQFLKRFPDVK